MTSQRYSSLIQGSYPPKIELLQKKVDEFNNVGVPFFSEFLRLKMAKFRFWHYVDGGQKPKEH